MSQPPGSVQPSAPGPHVAPLGSGAARVVGVVLMLPAVVLLLVQVIIPAVRTLMMSVTDARPFGTAELVGLENYARLVGVTPAVGHGLVAVLPAWALSAVLGLGLALTARGGPALALGGRVVTGVVLALFLPVGVQLTLWAGPLGRSGGLLALLVGGIAVGTAGSTGLHATLFAAALRRGAAVGRTVLAILVVGLAAALSLALQLFLAGYASRRSTTVGGETYVVAFQRAAFGQAAALSTVSGVAIVLLGVVAVAVLAASRLGFSVVERPVAPILGGTGHLAVLGVVAGLLALVGGVVAIVPHLAAQASAPPLPGGVLAGALVRMWGLGAVVAVVQVVVAGLAAIGIGWCRPFGRGSRWVLLLFAPWLFVGTVPLAIGRYSLLRTLGLLDTPVVAVPTWLSVPALVVLTLLADGLRSQRDAMIRPRSTGLVPTVVGVVAAVAGTVWVTAAYEVAWPLIVTVDPDRWPGTVVALAAMGSGRNGLGALEPVWLLLVVVALSVLIQALGLRRLGLGPAESEALPHQKERPGPEPAQGSGTRPGSFS